MLHWSAWRDIYCVTMRNLLTTNSFDDVDLAHEYCVKHGWATVWTQLFSTPCQIDLDTVRLHGLNITHIRLAGTFKNTFVLPPNVTAFSVPRQRTEWVFCGREIKQDMMVFSRLNDVHFATHTPGWDYYEFSLTDDLVRETEVIPPKFFKKIKAPKEGFLPLVEPATSDLVFVLDYYFHLIRAGNQINAQLFYEIVLEKIAGLISAGLKARDLQEVEPRSMRHPDLIVPALQILKEESATMTARQLAHRLGVSYRVLLNAMSDSVWCTPQVAIQIARLHRARQELKRDRDSTSEICMRNGFTGRARFYRMYRELFGESPSQTRRRGGADPD